MSVAIGDIVVFKGSIGHTGIICNITPTGIINILHAQGGDSDRALRSYAISSTANLGQFLETADIFTPPWHLLTSISDFSRGQWQLKLMSVAYTLFYNRVPYGSYEAARLLIGKSSMGKYARERIATYRQRFEQSPLMFDKCDGNFNIKLGQFIPTVTCVSAVLLCYHLTFNESHGVFFPDLDPEHTMPNTLREWLRRNWLFVSPKSPNGLPISWQQDHTTQVCAGCAHSFTFFKHRHHCRGCGQIFCNTCAPLRSGIKTDVRYCQRCTSIVVSARRY